jgi:hypothetical protein
MNINICRLNSGFDILTILILNNYSFSTSFSSDERHLCFELFVQLN